MFKNGKWKLQLLFFVMSCFILGNGQIDEEVSHSLFVHSHSNSRLLQGQTQENANSQILAQNQDLVMMSINSQRESLKIGPIKEQKNLSSLLLTWAAQYEGKVSGLDLQTFLSLNGVVAYQIVILHGVPRNNLVEELKDDCGLCFSKSKKEIGLYAELHGDALDVMILSTKSDASGQQNKPPGMVQAKEGNEQSQLVDNFKEIDNNNKADKDIKVQPEEKEKQNRSAEEGAKKQELTQKQSSGSAEAKPQEKVKGNQGEQKVKYQNKVEGIISNTMFSGIILSHEIPKVFLKEEVFTFKGELKSRKGYETRIHAIFTDVKSQKRLTFSHDLPANKTDFELQVKFTSQGNFTLSLFEGYSGTRSFTIYEIRPRPVNGIFGYTKAERFHNLRLFLEKNRLFVKWDSKGDNPALTMIAFKQVRDSKILEINYTLSNFQRVFEVPFRDFAAFYKGTVELTVSGAFSSSNSAVGRISEFGEESKLSFSAGYHHFSRINTEQITTEGLRERVPLGTVMQLSGKTAVTFRNQVVVLSPAHRFESYYLKGGKTTQNVGPYSSYRIEIAFREQGSYILEINKKAGDAAVNTPVYVGDFYPILPDFLDLTDEKATTLVAEAQPKTLLAQRELFLSLINRKRVEFGVKEVSFDNKLHQLAQTHTEDMARRGYSAHTNPQGETPQDRARKLGIYTYIGENIGVNPNLTDMHYRLCRSAIHLRNLVMPEWERVGLGISRGFGNTFYGTQEFAGRDYDLNPLTQGQFNEQKHKIIDLIMEMNPNLKGENEGLGSYLMKYMKMSRPRPNLKQYLGESYRRFMYSTLSVSFYNGYLDNIRESSYLKVGTVAVTECGIGFEIFQGKLTLNVAFT